MMLSPNEQIREFGANTVRELRANGTLREDEWKQIDDRLLEVAQHSLRAVQDLRDRGLTQSTDLGTLIHEFERTDEFEEAELDMGAETRGADEHSTFDLKGVPLPIAHKSFHIGFRQLRASRNRGTSLDTMNLAKATRSVSERLETLLFNGWAGGAQGFDIPGLRGDNREDNVNDLTGSDWTDSSGTDADDIRDDLIDGIELLENNNYGPEGTGYLCWIARENYQQLRRRDTGTDQERGLLERLEEEFEFVDFVRADHLDAGEYIMLKPVEDVVELVVASDITNVEWSSHADMTTHMKVMGSITPVVKSDKNGQSGIVNATGLSG